MTRPGPQAFKLADLRPRRRSLISLTPLIDVVFILLVFFMLASSFLDWHSIQLAAPAAEGSSPATDAVRPWTVAVGVDRLSLNGESITATALERRLKRSLEAAPERQFYLKPVGDTPLQRVISVLDRLHALGITRMELQRDPQYGDADAL